MIGRRVFYYCYSHQRPMGGQKHTYRHVDILTANGYDAYVFHDQEDYRLTWFDHDSRVIGPAAFATLYDPHRDVVVGGAVRMLDSVPHAQRSRSDLQWSSGDVARIRRALG